MKSYPAPPHFKGEELFKEKGKKMATLNKKVEAKYVIRAGVAEKTRIDKWLDFNVKQGDNKGLGKNGDQFWFDGGNAYSYGTLIAERDSKTRIFLNREKYSATTTKLQNYLEQGAKDRDIKVEEMKFND